MVDLFGVLANIPWKSKMSFLLGLLIVFLPSSVFASGKMDIPQAPQNFTPIARFTVSSDVHINENKNSNECRRLAKMFTKSYEIAAADSTYNKLDAVCFSGDITDRGTLEMFESFKSICDANIRPGTQLIAVLGNHDFGTYKADTRKVFEEVFGYAADSDFNVNGVHIITTAKAGANSTRGISEINLLRSRLAAAKKENPKNPIFVLQHEHIANTVYGSYNWGEYGLKGLLSCFPQVIDFSGHSHFPINDPRSIWQGGFTALGTGTLSYFELEVDGKDGCFPEGYRTAATMYVVEVDASSSVRIRGYDLISDKFLDGVDYYIPAPSDRSTFAYNTTNRLSKSENPFFEEGTQLSTSKNGQDETLVEFAAAKDSQIVHNYRVTVTDSTGKAVYDDFTIAGYFLNPQPSDYSINVGKLESGKQYKAIVIAENAYKKRSSALTLEFTA